jgi:putative addiction module killer protein
LIHRQLNLRLQLELGFSVGMGDVHVHPRLFPRKEEEAKRPMTENGRNHARIIAVATPGNWHRESRGMTDVVDGDCRPMREGVLELRVDYGPGYRVYFAWKKPTVVVLLTGGDKRSQKRDVQIAVELARGI